MNERLKELYLQAHSIRNYDGDPMRDGNPPDIYWQGETSAKRFAELIVRECARVSERTGVLNEAEFEGEMIADAIKEDFGVEQ